MSMPFYVSPEQLMKDRADFARKGIARGRSVIAVQYADGVLFVSENPSKALHKVSEIYDRIAFAAVGRYNEFENLRIAGVRLADEHGYAVMGGAAETVAGHLAEHYVGGASLEETLRIAVAALGHGESEDRVIPAGDLEVAALDRTRTQPRKFLRLRETRLVEILGGRGVEQADEAAPEDALAGAGPRQPRQGEPADPT